jgi:serine/threonine-protein kinase
MERALGSRYRLDNLVGSGTMGQVFSGADNEGNRFAFKILRSDLIDDPEFVARFLQERSILVGIRHPNLVQVHDLVAEGGTLAIVMDLVSGGDLRSALINAGTILPSEVARIGARVAAALAVIHEAGVVHRDVKPENVLLDDSTGPSTPRLTDFGIARFARQSSSGRSSLLAGTPQYVAPELAAGEESTAAADLYSLGILLYELCCGVTPFAGGSVLMVIRKHAELEPGKPNGIPNPLWELIAWLLAKTPRARPQSAQQVATLLDALSGELVHVPVALRLSEPPPGQPIAHHQPTLDVPGWPGSDPVASPSIVPPLAPPVTTKPGQARWAVLALTAVVVLVIGLVIGQATSSGGTAASGTSPGDGNVQTGQPTTPIDERPTTTETAVPSVDPNPVTVYLDTITPATGSWSSDTQTAQLNSQHYSDSLVALVDSCDSGWSQPQNVEYNLSKGYRTFTGVAGVDDGSPDSTFQVQVDIYGDGVSLVHQIVQVGKPAQINQDVTGVLRLKIVLTPINTANDSACSSDNYFAIGNAQLHGLADEVPRVTDTPTS